MQQKNSYAVSHCTSVRNIWMYNVTLFKVEKTLYQNVCKPCAAFCWGLMDLFMFLVVRDCVKSMNNLKLHPVLFSLKKGLNALMFIFGRK